MLAWKAKLVVLPTPEPVVLEYADMWVRLEQNEYGGLEAYVDVAFDVDLYGLVVFVDGTEFCSSNPMYGEEGYYTLSCYSPEVAHFSVSRVSAQFDNRGQARGLRCERSDHSDADRTLFACSWR